MTLSNDQSQALERMADFLQEENKTKVFVLRGSAGTGKTTLIKTLLDNKPDHFDEVTLCALTNKAAKVISQKTEQYAITLHRLLYNMEEDEKENILRLSRKSINPDTPTLIIVDEASMIGDKVSAKKEFFESSALLTDLLSFVFNGHPMNKLIIVGDPCQLPPIGYGATEESPALKIDYLNDIKKITSIGFELKQVLRQETGSYILESATAIRDFLLYHNENEVHWKAKILASPSAAINRYMNEFNIENESKVVLLAWTNTDVNWWNNAIRSRLRLDSKPLTVGTRVIIDRNWSDGTTVISKGETGIISSVDQQITDFAGLKFSNATIETVDINGNPFTCSSEVLLEHLQSHNGTLTPEQEKTLRYEAHKTNKKYREMERPWNDPYVGSLRLRYGYALTCHKAQGSEFNNVILHPYYPKEDKRWLYTAITRAKEELYMFKRA